MKTPLLCLKVGGSVITDKKVSYKANIEIIKQIAHLLKTVDTPMLISHGSGSFGHTSATKYGGKHGYEDKWGIAKVARDAMEINRIVMDIFIEAGLPAVSFRPGSFILSENGKYKDIFLQPLITALHQGLVPVIYGDVIWDTKWKSTIFSGETSLNTICLRLLERNYSIDKIIQFCDVDGVLDEKESVIPVISDKNWQEIKLKITSNSSPDVTGGMEHKIENALSITGLGIKTIIVNGNKQESVVKALHGEKIGTLVI